MKKLLIGFLLTSLVLVGCSSTSAGGAEYDEFAQCITDAGMTFYGAFWCGHCANQKQAFGDAMQYVNYVECDPRGENSQSEVCLEEGIEAYPTWKHADGRSWVGEQSFETLAEVTGCPAPTTTEE